MYVSNKKHDMTAVTFYFQAKNHVVFLKGLQCLNSNSPSAERTLVATKYDLLALLGHNWRNSSHWLSHCAWKTTLPGHVYHLKVPPYPQFSNLVVKNTTSEWAGKNSISNADVGKLKGYNKLSIKYLCTLKIIIPS